MSYLESGTNQVLRADHSHQCDHVGVIFCTKCKSNTCDKRMAPCATWKEKTKQKYSPSRRRHEEEGHGKSKH